MNYGGEECQEETLANSDKQTYYVDILCIYDMHVSRRTGQELEEVFVNVPRMLSHTKATCTQTMQLAMKDSGL